LNFSLETPVAQETPAGAEIQVGIPLVAKEKETTPHRCSLFLAERRETQVMCPSPLLAQNPKDRPALRDPPKPYLVQTEKNQQVEQQADPGQTGNLEFCMADEEHHSQQQVQQPFAFRLRVYACYECCKDSCELPAARAADVMCGRASLALLTSL
jgi:hypothetical protein